MAKEIKDLQQLINKKAEKRLNEDIFKLSVAVRVDILDGITLNVGTCEKPNVIMARYLFDQGSDISNKIFERNIDKYKAEETQKFLKKVESLRTDVDNLLNTAGLDPSTIEELPY